jgi:hypothetical protein
MLQKVYATEDDVGFDRSPFLTTTEMDILRSAGFTVAIIDVSLPTVSECTNQINSLLDRGFKVDTYRGCFTGCLIMVKQQIMELNMPKNW